jgi:hypothetical protein
VAVERALQGAAVSCFERLKDFAMLRSFRGNAIKPAIAGIVNARHFDGRVQASIGLDQSLIPG